MNAKATLLVLCSFFTTTYIDLASAANRYILLHNDIVGKTIYPVIEVPDDGNCRPGSTSLSRIIIPDGVSPGTTIQVNLPDYCWYKAGRVLLFLPNIEAYEKTLIADNQKTKKNGYAECSEVSRNANDGKIVVHKPVTCYTGASGSGYPLDSPAQLTEYTFDADDPETGKPSPDPDKGRFMADVDISYVDETFLPVSMAIDSGGTAGYMGTILPYDEKGSVIPGNTTRNFEAQVNHFLENNIWSSFAAYTKDNWNQNVFHDLMTRRIPHIMGGSNAVHNVNTKATSSLYKTSGEAYLIEKMTVNNKFQPSNPTVVDLINRWSFWLGLDPRNPDPCRNPPANPALNQKDFCTSFQATVEYVWEQYKIFASQDPNYCKFKGGDSKEYTIDEVPCLIGHILGYTQGPDHGRLPESVQAIFRAVPWNEWRPEAKSEKPVYEFDKWLLFWAPTNSSYNLNPFTRLIHNPDDGIDAVAYSFSIDDKYGNFRDEGTGIIINVGGGSFLANPTPFDAYQQYYVSWSGNNWDHATVCGRQIKINKQAGNARVSMWQNGQKKDYCDVIMYSSANNDTHLNYRLSEEPKRSVTDSYTGIKHDVQGLMMNPDYCKNNSSDKLKSLCGQENLSPVFTGENAYVSLKDKEKPNTTLNLAALPSGLHLNLAPGWLSATGCGLPPEAGKIDPKNGSSFELKPGKNQTVCPVLLSSSINHANFNIKFSNGVIDPTESKCTKNNTQRCLNVLFTPNNINVATPGDI